MAVNIFELARQFGGVLEEPKDQQIDPAELAKQFGGEVVRPAEAPAQTAPSTTPPPVTGFRGFGEGAAETFRNIVPTIAELFKQTGFGVTSRAVDRLPDSIDTPPPGVPIEDIDRAGGVREYYAQVYGIRSDEELRKVKEESQRRTAARVEASQQRVAELTPQDLNLLQRGIRGGVESLGVMAPTVLASIATRSPVPALAGAGALEGFGGYAEARAEGLNPNSALAYGGVNAAIEVATEIIPAKKLLDAFKVKTTSELKDVLLKFAAGEMLGEQAATAGQSLNALAFGLDEELANAKTPEEFARIQGERQALTAISTIVAGGTQAGGISAINKVREEMVRRDIESQVRDIEEVGSEIERQRIDEIRNQALEDAQSIAAPDLNEIALDQGQTAATPEQYGDNYAQKVYDSVGQYIPANAEFKVEEKVIDGTPRFVVTDNEGIQYGQTLQDKAQADAFSLSLNNTTKSRAELLKQLEPLESSLKETIRGLGLNDVGLTLSNRVFTRRGEALTSEGLFDPVVRRVFLAVDAVDPQGNLDATQRREALRGVLRHEVVHALRYLDLWKRSEWKNLEKTVGKVIKPGTNKTYLEIAKEAYGDQSPVIQVEEGVADLIRDVAGNQSRIAGKPRSLSERAINFFDKAKNALTGAGFQTYEDIVQRFERGDIGARQRGRIRTFRATEEQQAARGEVPERLQRLFTNPQERNQFRTVVAQKVESQIPADAVPARSSLRLNAVRESRSTIDPVPPKITVNNQEVPTQDSEGRLIYSGYEGPEVFGMQTRPTQEGLQNFWNWFGKSKAVDDKKRPLVYYHGTAADITAFQPKQAGSVFVTKNPIFAEEFSFYSDNYMVSNFPDFMSDEQVVDALNETLSNPTSFTPKKFDEMAANRDRAIADLREGKPISPDVLKSIKDVASKGISSRYLNAIQKRLPSSANLMPVYVSAQNPFDYNNKDHVKQVINQAEKISGIDLDSGQIEGIKSGDWGTIESPIILDAIKSLGFDSMYVEEQGEKNLAVFDPNQIKSAVGNNGDFSPITPSIRESRIPRAPKSQVFFEVAPDPNNPELTNAWRGLNPQLRLDISERVAQQMIPSVLSAVRSNGNVVNQVGSYLDDTNPSFALMVQSGNPLEISKAIGFVLSQDSMMVVSLTPFKGGDLVPAISINIGNKAPQEVEAIYNSLREIEVGGNKPVGGQTFANGHMTILNYSDVQTDQLADLIDKKLNGQYNVLSRDVYSAFPEKKDYDYASPQDDGSGSKADLRQRLRGLRAEASGLVEREVGVGPQRAGDRGRRDQGRVLAPLEGAPNVQGGGPIPEIVSVAEQYAAQKGLPYQRQPSYVEVDETRAKRIADAFEAMKHDPKNPAVAEAYRDLIKQTRDQYDALVNSGYNFTFFDSATDPYGGNPWNAMRDLRDNKRMAVYGTYDGYGTAGITDTELENNPLLEDTGLRWPDQNGVERMVTANDLFRAVHDAFGHGLEGSGFRARGEENAWQAHARLFTGPALAALTTETRGQNSWLNYGPYGEKNRTARVEDTVFAEQKIGLLPNWTWQEGLETAAPRARESRPPGTPIGPEQPGPSTDTDNTSAAEALNNGQPVDSIGTPIGPTISDTMPDGTVDISGARIAPMTRRLVVQMIQSAPDKLRSGMGLDDLAKRIENYYDSYSSRLGVVNGIVREAFNRIPFRDRNAALVTFEQFIRARENNRTEEAQAILDSATDSERQLIDAWNEISLRTGEINTSLRTPDGKPMRVWDAKRGEWRPIRSVRNFFPRAFRREVMEVMQNPDLDPALWQSLLDSLIASGRAENTQDAEKYLLREWFSDEIKQDYFSGVEKARNEPLPEIFYDYSWDAATRYMRKWSRRTAQIENFGQTLGTFQKEWFDANIPKVRDPQTQNYLNAIKERIYEIEQFSVLTNMANWTNSLATATQLGNPVSASLNLLGGTVTNVQEFGIKEIAKAYIELVKDWSNVQKEGTTLGILNKDFMNILNDHVEMDADKYFSKEQKISQALAKFTNVMLTIGGFNGAENIVRSAAMLAARSRLNSFLDDVNNGQETKQVQAFREWVKRENLDIDALILEDGAGKETERFMRRAVNVPQGSYNIDMTPVFIDSAAGRFLLKYQKFGTQINRFFYNHFLKPFYESPNPKNFMRIAGFLGTAIVGGGAIIAIREVFGYGDPGPDDEEIVKAFENEDTARGWGLIFSRAWQNIMTAGSLGFFANYAQFAKDWQDQQRVKNPFSPPGLSSVDAVIDIFNRLRDQGKLTARDLDEIAEGTLSFYRANKRIALAGMDSIGVDAREVRRFAVQRDIREVREYGRRYSEAMEIEFKQRTAPGKVVRTPMTPTNKAIADALQQGDSVRARLLIRDAKEGLTVKDKQKVMASIRAAVRNRQPIQIGGNAPSQQELQAFMRWSRQNLPAEKYQMIRQLDRQYKRAAARAGVGFGD